MKIIIHGTLSENVFCYNVLNSLISLIIVFVSNYIKVGVK